MCVVQAQSKSDTDKLIADLTNLVSSHIRRQHELVRCFLLHLFLSLSRFVSHKLYVLLGRLIQDSITLKMPSLPTKLSWTNMSLLLII